MVGQPTGKGGDERPSDVLAWLTRGQDTVTLNGTDNTPGTARSYLLQGIPTTETLMMYEKPTTGPYQEVHNTALVNFGAIGAYIMYDGTHVTPTCGGQASVFNMTASFCSNAPAQAEALLHQVHLADILNVGRMLGGRNFTTCADLTTLNALDVSAWAASQVSDAVQDVTAPVTNLLDHLLDVDVEVSVGGAA